MHFYLVCMTSMLCEGVGWVGEGTNSTKTPSFYHFLQLQGSESSEKKKKSGCEGFGRDAVQANISSPIKM